MAAAGRKCATIRKAPALSGLGIANAATRPVHSPARNLQLRLDTALTETRWSARKTLAVVFLGSAVLWAGLISAGVTVASALH